MMKFPACRKKKLRKLNKLLGDESDWQERAKLELERQTKSVVWGTLYSLLARK